MDSSNIIWIRFGWWRNTNQWEKKVFDNKEEEETIRQTNEIMKKVSIYENSRRDSHRGQIFKTIGVTSTVGKPDLSSRSSPVDKTWVKKSDKIHYVSPRNMK